MAANSPHSIITMELGPMENFIYLIHDHESGRAAVVDPAWDATAIITTAEEKGIHISDILLTHSHHDHVNAVTDILNRFDSQLHLLAEEAKFWGHYQDLPTTHHGGDNIELGQTNIKILHTPGHTPGSACYQIDKDLITGDTLFVYGCGRCDLAGGNPETMYHTLNNLTENFPSDTMIYPGHNYAESAVSTMSEQLSGNPFLHFDNIANFVRYRMHDHDRTRDTPYLPVQNKPQEK